MLEKPVSTSRKQGFAIALLDQAGALQGGVTPEHYMRRELAKYRETRVLGGAGGTMIWNTDADDSQS